MPGEVPSGWIRTTLGDLFSWSSGKKPPFTIEPEGRIPVFGSNGILGFGPEANVARVYLVGRVGASGSLHAVRAAAWANDNTLVAEPSNGRADFGFLGFLLDAANLPSLATKTAQPLLTQSNLKPIGVALPPLPEQKKIAAILSSVDEAIQATQAVIDQTRRVKEGLLQDLLTRGLPGHTRFKQTEIGEIPESWAVRRLDELLSEGPRNGVYKAASDIGEGTLIIGQTAFTTDRMVDCAAARRARATDDDLIRYGLRRGDILIARVYATQEGCGRPAMVTDLPEPAIYESNMMRIRGNEKRSMSSFLFHWLLHPVARRILMSKSSSSNQTSINQETVGGLACPQPPLHEQDSIVSILASCDQQVSDGRRELAALTTTKSGLLQDLLTGKVRVNP